MVRQAKYFVVWIGILILAFSCRKEEIRTAEQMERDAIIASENLLRDNFWGFRDLKVTVAYETQAMPFLANVADASGMVQAGTYYSYDIFGNSNRQLKYNYQFLRDDVMLDTTGNESFAKIGGYFVLSTTEIRINPDSSAALRFSYNYNEEDELFHLNSGTGGSNAISEAFNQRISDAILSDKPGDISEGVVNLIFENEKIHAKIEQVLYDLIHGKIEEISANPEEAAEQITHLLAERLQEVDWESLLNDKLLELLSKLQTENPEEKALELAERIADKIEASLSYDNLYEVILPVMEELEEEKMPVLATEIAEAVYGLIDKTLSEEKLYDRLLPLWEQFALVDSNAVVNISDTLSQLVIANHFDTLALAEQFVPFLIDLDATKIYQLGAMSQDIIDNTLIPIVDTINAKFPTLDLNPDWDIIKPILTTALTTIKASMGGASPEDYSIEFAGTVIDVFGALLPKAFEAAIFKLQEIPATQAATVISAWLSNLVDMAEPAIVTAIETRLNEILALFDAQKVAQELSTLIYNKLLEVFSEENIYQLVLPILELLNDLDMERIANVLSQWILESDKLNELIDEEILQQKLVEILTGIIGQINPDETTTALVNAILNSDIVQNLEGDILGKFISFKTYTLLIDISRDINAIDEVEVILYKK